MSIKKSKEEKKLIDSMQTTNKEADLAISLDEIALEAFLHGYFECIKDLNPDISVENQRILFKKYIYSKKEIPISFKFDA